VTSADPLGPLSLRQGTRQCFEWSTAGGGGDGALLPENNAVNGWGGSLVGWLDGRGASIGNHCLLDDISSWVENLIYSHICPTTMGDGGRGPQAGSMGEGYRREGSREVRICKGGLCRMEDSGEGGIA
jgi:hypothetical protein